MPRKPLTQIDIEKFRISFCKAAYELYMLKGYDAVTMRGTAKIVGCSAMMAYRYFEKKEDVFAALRTIHFDCLAETLEGVIDTLSTLEYMRNLAKAYAAFAHENPHAYRLLYMTPIDQFTTYPEAVRAQQRTQNVLFDASLRAVKSGSFQGDPVLLAHTLWASIHGLVSLDLSKQLHQGLSFDTLFSAMLDHILGEN